MNNLRHIVLNLEFNSKCFTVGNLKLGDNYLNVNVGDIADIYVKGNNKKLSIIERYESLSYSDGFIHLKEEITLEILNSQIRSIRIRVKYQYGINLKNESDVLQMFGVPDIILKDSISWWMDYSIEAFILVYRNYNLYFHIDPESKKLKEIGFGDINELDYQ